LITFDIITVKLLSSFVQARYLFVNNEIYKPFLLNSRAQAVCGKNEQFAQTPWRGAPRSAGPNAAESVASA